MARWATHLGGVVRYRSIMAATMAVAVTALSVSACKRSKSGGSSSSGAGGGGGGGTTLTISSDLPLQGAQLDTSKSTNQAIQLYLDQIGHKAGKYTIQFKSYDDSTAAAGKWDPAKCGQNAQDHVANKGEVAVMGTFNSGCAKLIVPVLEQDPTGPMLMVSHANTNVGLTKKWDAGEPDKYYPLGKRNYARVVTTDDFQGAADADYLAQDAKVKNCYVLNDGETYGQGVASAFVTEAKKIGLNILGNEKWDKTQSSYAALFQSIKTKNPDCVFLGGIIDNNGAKLIADKVAVLGDNTKVRLMAPDGFTGSKDVTGLPQAAGMNLSFAGLSLQPLVAAGGAGAKLVTDYKAKYGKDPASYALYGVAALQVILAAIAKSDGTRASVTSQVLGGSGITIPADQSVTGKAIVIDPATGDTSAKDISIEVIKDQAEAFVKAQSVQ